MTPLDAALSYAARGWRVFPAMRKDRPLVKWMAEATTDEAQIRAWWKRWDRALIGLPTGEAFCVLDVDVKASPTGFDTLEELGVPWARTPTVITPSGGAHAYFAVPYPPIRNTNGGRGRGIGPQLDWRGLGGYVIAPSPNSGYRWDDTLDIDTTLAEVPVELMPRSFCKRIPSEAVRPCNGLSDYAEGALDRAARAIIGAPNGEQERTLNGECFSIGTLVGAGAAPENFCRDVLQWAARKMVSYDHRRPWRDGELVAKVNRAFDAGMRQPRESGHA
jgi:putative DNA primase/helicase